ncbi:hypothetical protein [Pseudonocardia acaciae]|uniref:hypothetical protein n=1 Tax=Pseudonocardia acaciae TaxID=551276 RepID=UPI000568DED7|nr:hypothetical protein [Pseudonocardia acaciae]
MRDFPGAAYRRRPVRFLELWEDGGWRTKVYGIAADRELPGAELVAAAKRVARATLPQPARGPDRYGIAFLTVHEGREGAWALLDWWVNGNQVHHHLFGAAVDTPSELRPVGTGLMACTWELAVLAFEREAWLREFTAEEPSEDRYLAARLTAEV